MRLAILLPSVSRDGGGVSEAGRLHCHALADKADVVVHAINDPHAKDDIAAWPNVPIRLHRVFGTRKYAFAPTMLFSLLKDRPDVVHVHGVWQFHCLAVFIWHLLTGKPYVVTPHGMLEPWIRARSPGLKKLVSRLYQDRFLRRCAAFQILTGKEQENVQEYLSGQTAAIIPNYVPPAQPSAERPQWWDARFEGRDIYLFLGRIHEKKGCLELLTAWQLACERSAGFMRKSVLVFGGWIDGLRGFETAVDAAASSGGDVIYAGPQYGAEKHATLASASFFLLPSKSEGLPMTVLEAWAYRIPVLMSRECNLPEGFDKRAAVLSGPTIVSIEQSLFEASAMDEEERRRMGEAGLELVREKYSMESIRQALLNLYALVCKGKQNGTA